MSSTEQMIACIKQWDLVIPMSMQVKLYHSSKSLDPFRNASYTDALESMKKSLFNSFSVEAIAEAYALNCMAVFDSRKDSDRKYNYNDEILEAHKYTEKCVLAIEEHITSEKMKAFLDNKFKNASEPVKQEGLLKAPSYEMAKPESFEIKDEHYVLVTLMFVFGWLLHPLISLTGGISLLSLAIAAQLEKK